MRCFAFHWCWLILIGYAVATAPAQDASEDEQSPYLPGLIATYQANDAANREGEAPANPPIRRIDESLVFDWQSAAPDPRLTSSEFSAAWKGRLMSQAPGPYQLRVYAAGGQVSLKLAGRELIRGVCADPQWLTADPVELSFDYHPLEVTFQRSPHAQREEPGAAKARLAVFWSGPNFVLEPIPERFLFHDRAESPGTDFGRGRRLAAALRCVACHGGVMSGTMPAPALDRLSGNIETPWLVDWLSAPGANPQQSPPLRRMPHFQLSRQEAAHIAAWLTSFPAEKSEKGTKGEKGGDGQRLFLTVGCLACHQQGEVGESGLFGGGDLTNIAAKRPKDFFARWLADPTSLNRHHRMPVFDLSDKERQSLAMYLSQKKEAPAVDAEDAVGNALRGIPEAGQALVVKFRCAACHALPGEGGPLAPRVAGEASEGRLAGPLSKSSDWSRSCAAEPDEHNHRPGFRLAENDRKAMEAFFAALGTPRRALATPPVLAAPSHQELGRDLLVELNCLACHQREGIDRRTSALPALISEKLKAVVDLHDHLAKEVPAMTPPALNGVGDKLHDAALAAAIRRQGPPHRPYLLARMPKYELSDEQLATLVSYFTTTDRIPSVGNALRGVPKAGETPAPREETLRAAGPRLVTTDGFGCTSCHQVGSQPADKAPLNARGPNISMLGQRIRREWFNRWCYSPARIVPRMEMPSIQVPVRGVLGEKIDDQLAAVWHILNTPDFEPPEPNPVRVLRHVGDGSGQPIVLNDVIKSGDKTYLFPLVIGLPNRHNVLFDLETNRLANWWLGDTARQRTKGKTWYWEAGGKALLPVFDDPEISLTIGGKEWLPTAAEQFQAQLYSLDRGKDAFPGFSYQLRLASKGDNAAQPFAMVVRGRQHFGKEINPPGDATTGIRRDYSLQGTGSLEKSKFRLVAKEIAKDCKWDATTHSLHVPGESGVSIYVRCNDALMEWNGDGTLTIYQNTVGLPGEGWLFFVELKYVTTLPVDRYLNPIPPPIVTNSIPVEIAPGFRGRRLPLPDDIMPTALDWKADRRLVFTSLKGQVFAAEDTDGDGAEDSPICLADGLATPYGLCCGPKHDLVSAKNGVLRLIEGFDECYVSHEIVASGWGVTDDYHDWAVGMARGESGSFYIALPCQQDKRTDAAAKHRGQLLKLVPAPIVVDRGPNLIEEMRGFNVQVLSSGHRFPMGLARNREGELFVSDNQGNYNPYNELNHVRPAAHFGFVNANEKERGYKAPPVAAPVVNIPHPWTRSVNGICFLDTPEAMQSAGRRVFGPLEGHLIGCEYDTRRLIRMTLQKVGETYQGAAYPLSIPPRNVEDGLLGPLVCSVSPSGDLYVGNIRDSGWGAGSNVGDIVQIKIEPEKLPCGIAEVLATKEGFTIDFFQPVDRKRAADLASYVIASYRRESTPAYGGPNLDRRTEKVESLDVSPDATRVTLKLAPLREGFVYEFQLKSLAPGQAMFHPAEAHYTLNKFP